MLERFGDYTFPIYEPTDNLNTAPALSRLTAVRGGAFDATGADPAVGKNYTLTKKFTVVADTRAALETAIDAAKAKVNVRGKLYARIADGTVRWVLARCTAVNQSRTKTHKLHQPLEMVFEIPVPGWSGTQYDGGWVLDAGEILDGGMVLDGAKTTIAANSHVHLTLSNAGNRPVSAVTLKITAGDAPITSTLISRQVSAGGATVGYNWEYLGDIAAGKTAVIDCGIKSIKNDGTADAAHWSPTMDHNKNDWLVLDPGANYLFVGIDGGGTGSTVEVIFRDGWQ